MTQPYEGARKPTEEYLGECVTITPEAIEEEFVRTPADVAFWNAQYAEALDAYLRAKHHEERTWARVWMLRREELIATGGKPTEKLVDAATESDPEYQAAREALIVAEVAKARSQGQVDAVKTKKDMLQSLGAKLRAEMESDPLVRRDQARIGGRG